MATSEVKTGDPGIDPSSGEFRVIGQGQTFRSVTEKISRIVLTPPMPNTANQPSGVCGVSTMRVILSVIDLKV